MLVNMADFKIDDTDVIVKKGCSLSYTEMHFETIDEDSQKKVVL